MNNQSFAISKYLLFFCLFATSLQATTTFTINDNVIFNSSSGNELSWLNSHSDVTGSGTPYTIIITEGAQWKIDAAVFNTNNLGNATSIIIEGQSPYPSGGQLSFSGNGSKLMLHGFDALYVSTINSKGLDVFTHVGHIKVQTDCEEYKGNQLGNIIANGGVTGNCSPLPAGTQLPVEWASFTVRLSGTYASLLWETASELNNDHFVVEHSKDGIHFSAIGTVEGSGTSNKKNTYRFVHQYPLSGRNYYRIQQVDFGGAENGTPVEMVNVIQDDETPIVHVNATAITVANDSEETINTPAFIFDMSGRQVAQFTIIYGQTTFDISNLPAGIYVIAMKNGNANFSERFFKP